MKGCIPVNPNKENDIKYAKYKAALAETQDEAERNKADDPPGVFMPPETELSPPQFG
jgi:hypothetical protein